MHHVEVRLAGGAACAIVGSLDDLSVSAISARRHRRRAVDRHSITWPGAKANGVVDGSMSPADWISLASVSG